MCSVLCPDVSLDKAPVSAHRSGLWYWNNPFFNLWENACEWRSMLCPLLQINGSSKTSPVQIWHPWPR